MTSHDIASHHITSHHIISQRSTAYAHDMSCITCTGDSNHPDLAHIHPFIYRLHASTWNITSDSEQAHLTRLTHDYASLLHVCSTIAPYTLILEDDIIATSHVVQKLQHVVYDIRISAAHDWAFVKLYRGELWTGWQTHDIAPMIGVCLACGIVVGWSMRYITRTRVTIQIQLLITVYITLMLISIAVALGRQNIIMRRYGLHETDEGCCCQAHLYPSYHIPTLITYLHTHAHTAPHDLLLDSYATSHTLKRYLHTPSLFQHMGLFSTRMEGNHGDVEGYQQSMSFTEE